MNHLIREALQAHPVVRLDHFLRRILVGNDPQCFRHHLIGDGTIGLHTADSSRTDVPGVDRVSVHEHGSAEVERFQQCVAEPFIEARETDEIGRRIGVS